MESDVAISDVEADATEFGTELEFLEDFDRDTPAIVVGGVAPGGAGLPAEAIPVALSVVIAQALPWTPGVPPHGHPWRSSPLQTQLALEALSQALANRWRDLPGLVTISRDHARSTFLRRGAAFLATRLSSVGTLRNQAGKDPRLTVYQRVGGPRISIPGCKFAVSTNSPGLRVFWSGAYRLSGNYFSHPTTPARGVLQAGTYIFGVDGGAYGNATQWDTSAVVTLPGQPMVHLNY
jgi:hypothetical protein